MRKNIFLVVAVAVVVGLLSLAIAEDFEYEYSTTLSTNVIQGWTNTLSEPIAISSAIFSFMYSGTYSNEVYIITKGTTNRVLQGSISTDYYGSWLPESTYWLKRGDELQLKALNADHTNTCKVVIQFSK